MKETLISKWKKAGRISTASMKKLVKRLVDKKNRNIDQDADQVHTQVFRELDCLDCANCCKSIPPMLVPSDIKRIAKYLGLKVKTFEYQYLRMDEDGDLVMKISPCFFLGTDNKCAIYEVRPKACREYPHTDAYEFRKNAHLHALNAGYCPAVYHILQRLNEVY
jgi:Fe-S-cluster containining protein